MKKTAFELIKGRKWRVGKGKERFRQNQEFNRQDVAKGLKSVSLVRRRNTFQNIRWQTVKITEKGRRSLGAPPWFPDLQGGKSHTKRNLYGGGAAAESLARTARSAKKGPISGVAIGIYRYAATIFALRQVILLSQLYFAFSKVLFLSSREVKANII